MTDRITDLEIFQAIVEYKSLSIAAEKLLISKATVSRSLQQLERWLDTRLVIRTTRNIEVTPSGQRLLEEGREILHKIDTLQGQLSHDRQTVSGELRVSLPLGISNYFFSVLPRFIQKYPNVRLNVEQGDNYVDLTSDHFDLAIRAGTLSDSSMFARKLFSFDEIIVASPWYITNYGKPNTLDDIESHSCILDTNHFRYDRWVFIENKKAVSVSIAGNLILSQTNAVVEAAIAGIGLAYLPRFAVCQALKEKQLIQVLKEYPSATYDVNVIFPDRDFLPKKTRVFIDFLVEAFRDGIT